MNGHRVLVIDDEANILQVLKRALAKKECEVLAFSNGEEALDALERFRPELVVSDIVLPGMDGIEVLKRVKAFDPEVNVLLITAHASLETAIFAIREGASDYLIKPFKIAELSQAVQKALSSKRLFFRDDKGNCKNRYELKTLIGSSEAIASVRDMISRVARTDSTVMITGESGTGKELVARLIHCHSGRKGKPFVSINCAALPETLLESELFGYEKGSFTGATSGKAGLLELANEGTFFFDEIGEIAPSTQAKLLRVLQERELRHVGGLQDIRVDIRIVAATSRNLAKEVEARRFREDLFYRLNVVPVHMPALRERRGDIPMFLDFFLSRFSGKYGREIRFASDAASFLEKDYDWPGNVRELENLTERVSMLAEEGEVSRAGLLRWMDSEKPESAASDGDAGILDSRDLKSRTEAFERQLIAEAIRESGGRKFRAAKMLKISRQNLQYKMKKYGLDR
ncbi:MAG TPA: sigma-54 dependent transcriptional regulator [Candidatus Omnitrophota bacterium]|nr:sigma-54 dependent transcriptional regulator [Candidatus Omnitrophota bacterium]